MFLDETSGPQFCRTMARHFNAGQRRVLLETDGDLVPDTSRGVFYFNMGTDAEVLANWLEAPFDLVVVLSAGSIAFANEDSENLAQVALAAEAPPVDEADEYSAMAAEILDKKVKGLWVPDQPAEKVALVRQLFAVAACSRALIVEDADNLFPTQEGDKQLLDSVSSWNKLADTQDNVFVVLIARSIVLLHPLLTKDQAQSVVRKTPPGRQEYLEMLETAQLLHPDVLEGCSLSELAAMAERCETPYRVFWQLILWCEAEGIRISPQLIGQRARRKSDSDSTKVVEKPSKTFADVAGLADVKAEITRRVILPFRHPEKAQSLLVKVGGGVLLFGPPGTGKTLIAQAIAGELDAPFFTATAADILSKYYGESLQKVSRLFSKLREAARKYGISVIFIDEVDGLLRDRDASEHEVTQRVVNQFLTELDGFNNTTESILVLFATNKPWLLDKALRPPRVHVKLYVPLPDHAARRQVWKLKLKGRACGDVDLDLLAEHSEGFSGADIEGITESVAQQVLEASASGDTAPSIEMADISTVLQHTTPSVTPDVVAQYEHYLDAN